MHFPSCEHSLPSIFWYDADKEYIRRYSSRIIHRTLLFISDPIVSIHGGTTHVLQIHAYHEDIMMAWTKQWSMCKKIYDNDTARKNRRERLHHHLNELGIDSDSLEDAALRSVTTTGKHSSFVVASMSWLTSSTTQCHSPQR